MHYSHTLRAGLVLAALLGGCAKPDKEAAAPPCDCPDLPPFPGGIGPFIRDGDATYSFPSFNPRNPHEIAYEKADYRNNANSGLYTANLDTRQSRLIRAGIDAALQVRWGPTGWLAMTRDLQVWKVKANGDSLTQLTNTTYHYQPQWSPDGQRLVCLEDQSARSTLVFIDPNGRPLGQLGRIPASYCQSWSPDGTKLLVTYRGPSGDYGLGLHDLTTHQTTQLVNMQRPDGNVAHLTGAVWLPDSRNVVWTNDDGIFTFDTQTRQSTRLHAGCGTRLYEHPDVSADGRTIVVCRTDKDSKDGMVINWSANIWLMDIDGRNERKIVF